ncbi:MAG: pyridoxamine 5'-phosphate oxidase family protein [Capsulimonas sp.]|uniref:pyridoxamine 5'-phosphate oxidase family protein n=1 Tax=Capsulimonas sp. TaxID=2494211 RepID=UPI0032639328
MSDTLTQEEKITKIREFIKDIDFGMLTTIAADGSLHSRPMSANKNVEFDGDLWFFTNASTLKVDEALSHHQVNVSFTQPKDQRYVSVAGTAELVRDKEKIKELWEPELKAWFPNGVDEPDIALLKVNAKSAEFWEGPSSFVAYAVGMVKALATGEQYQGGQNGRVDF